MSVFTTVSDQDAAEWLKSYAVGSLTALRGIAAGVSNTNYFLNTTHGRFVLTLFENIPVQDLPFYLHLMAHLAQRGVPVPGPVADLRGQLMSPLNGKPATLVHCLPGQEVLDPSPQHAMRMGEVLAEMHLAGASYPRRLDNPRGPIWWHATAAKVIPFLDEHDTALLRDELHVQGLHRHDHLPRGVIHADLFRDNVLWDGDRVGGLIDFYFACQDVLLYDVAVTVNDWCVMPDGALDPERAGQLLAAYHAVRPLTEEERAAWPVMLRAAALRFWLSRLYDKHLPAAGELTYAKDPDHFKRVLLDRRDRAPEWLAPWP